METDNHVDGKRAFKEFKIRKWREERREKICRRDFTVCEEEMWKERVSLCYGKLEFFLLLLDILSPLEYIFTLPQKLLLKWVRTLSPLI